MSNFDYLMSGIMVAAATIILNMFLTILIRSKVSTMSKWVDFLYKREVRLKRQQEAYQEQKEMRDDVAFYVFNCDALKLQKMYQRMKEIKNEKDNS